MSRALCSHPCLAVFILLSALSCMAALPVFGAVVLPAAPPLSDAVRTRIEAAAADPALPAWQRDLMRGLAQGDPTADDGEWSELAPTRAMATAIYDPLRDRILVFGGYDESRYRNDVLVLSLAGTPAWSTLVPAGTAPDARIGQAAIYDPVRDRMIVFGGLGYDGVSYSRRNDTWALSLAGTPAWTQLAPTGSLPAARDSHTAIYDPVRDRMVIFGGFAPPSTNMNDTWALSLAGTPAWTQLTPSGPLPSARFAHRAIHDPVRDRMVIFGGQDTAIRNDTWALSFAGTPAWTPLAPAGPLPAPRNYSTAIYDPVRDRILIFGGYTTAPGFANDTWALSLAGSLGWTQLAPTGSLPRARWLHTAMYDPGRDRMVMYGGQEASGTFRGSLNDTWALSLAATPAWTPLPPAPPNVLASHSAIYDPVRDRIVIFGGYNGTTYRNETWALSLGGTPAWNPLTPAGSPPAARGGHSAIYDPVRDRMVIFGGSDAAAVFSDVWELRFTGTPVWSQLSSGPAARTYHTAIYDPVRDRMVIFGGTDGLALRSEVWTLSFTETPVWSQLSAGIPSGRIYHSAIYDPVRDRMVVFGGFTGTFRADTWSFPLGGTPVWTQLTEGGPAARGGHTAIYDPLRDRMVIFGGYDGSAYWNDTWSFDLGAPAWAPLAPGGSPPFARRYHAATYDPMRDRMVVMGGYDGSAYRNDTWMLTWGERTDVAGGTGTGGAPSGTAIARIYPNPATATQRFDLAVTAEERARAFRIYDVRGRLVWSRDLRALAPGPHALDWNGADMKGRRVCAGTYFAVLETASRSSRSTLVRVR